MIGSVSIKSKRVKDEACTDSALIDETSVWCSDRYYLPYYIHVTPLLLKSKIYGFDFLFSIFIDVIFEHEEGRVL